MLSAEIRIIFFIDSFRIDGIYNEFMYNHWVDTTIAVVNQQ